LEAYLFTVGPRAERARKLAVRVVLIYLCASLFASVLLAELTLHPYRMRLTHEPQLAERYSRFGASLNEVTLRASDGAELGAWYSSPAHANGRAVILLHGISDNREGVAGYGEIFLAAGYTVLMPDSRAHGESGGTVATFGLLESDDIRGWVDWLYKRGASCVDGFGESMGASLVLESMRAGTRYCAVVADSPYSTLRQVAYDREGLYVGLARLGGEYWVGRTIGLLPTELALLYARWRYGVDLLRANPLDAVRSSTTPVLLIHGLDDINVLPRHSLVLAHANPAHVELWLVPGAAHCGAVAVKPIEFRDRVVSFFNTHPRMDRVQHF
jgi:dipeptidyl aminopeptidase/acylaminoacyl peptidase